MSVTTFSDLLRQVPRETEREVHQAVDRARAAIRDALRAECRLTLNPSVDDGLEREQRVRVPVTVDSDIPDAFARAELPPGYERAMALLPHVPLIRAIAARGRELALAGAAVHGMPGSQPSGIPPGVDVIQFVHWAEETSAALDGFDPLSVVLRVDKDVLGAYRFRGGYGGDQSEIRLFWLAIGFIAKQLDATVEDLTVVTLTHEYAHAFTHLGADIDAGRWDTAEFAAADTALVEALAQYYSWRALLKLRPRFPGALTTFHRLLPHQHQVYRNHEDWASHVPVEAVRQALLEVRRTGSRTLAEFEHFLDGAVGRVPPLRQVPVDADDGHRY